MPIFAEKKYLKYEPNDQQQRPIGYKEVNMLKSGCSLNEREILNECERKTSLVAKQQVSLIQISKNQFQQILCNYEYPPADRGKKEANDRTS